MHEHTECEHELKYCIKCDTVYCEKCKQEWVKKFNYNVWYNGTISVPSINSEHIHVSY